MPIIHVKFFLFDSVAPGGYLGIMQATKTLPETKLVPKEAERVALNCSIDPELSEVLRAFAHRRNVTISSVVAVAVTEYLHREFSK